MYSKKLREYSLAFQAFTPPCIVYTPLKVFAESYQKLHVSIDL